MNKEKLDEWDEQGDPNDFINDDLAGSEMRITIDCKRAQLQIKAADSWALRQIFQLTDAILSNESTKQPEKGVRK